VEKTFDEIAGEWNERHAEARAWLPLFLKYFKKTDVVLDAGCGNANNSIAIAPLVKKIYAIDVSRNMLKFARKNVRNNKLNRKISLKRASVLSLPFKNSFFDVCAYFAVVHHFQRAADRKKVFREMNRVLKSGGRAFVTVWNKINAKALARPANRNMFVNFTKKTGEQVPRMHHFYAEREIISLAEKSGFAVLKLFFEKSGKRVAKAKGKNLCLVLRKA